MLEKEMIGSQIVGDGSACIALFQAADRKDVLQVLLNEQGIAVVGANHHLGGKLGTYNIIANSPAPDFFEGTYRYGAYAQVLKSPEARTLRAYGRDAAPLPVVGRFLSKLGEKTAEFIRESSRSQLLLGRKVEWVRFGLSSDGKGESYTSYDQFGQAIVESRRLILATGGLEVPHPELENYKERLVMSGDVLTGEALPKIEELLQEERGNERIAVAGGDHSGELVPVTLKREENLRGVIKGIDIISRREPRLFYPNHRAARKARYQFDPIQDVCSQTGRINRFGGLRGPAAEQYQQCRKEDEAGFVRLHIKSLEDATDILKNASVVVQALGYGANPPLIIDHTGQAINLKRGLNKQVMVDDYSRVYDGNGKAVPTLYGIGLGYGIRPSLEIGGEPSFKGVLDGFNVVCTVVAPRVIDDLLSHHTRSVSRREIVYQYA